MIKEQRKLATLVVPPASIAVGHGNVRFCMKPRRLIIVPHELPSEHAELVELSFGDRVYVNEETAMPVALFPPDPDAPLSAVREHRNPDEYGGTVRYESEMESRDREFAISIETIFPGLPFYIAIRNLGKATQTFDVCLRGQEPSPCEHGGMRNGR